MTQQLIAAELAATEPANADEAAEFDSEESTLETGATPHFKMGHPATKLKKAKLSPAGTYRKFSKPLKPTKYALGLKSTKEEAQPYLSYPVSAQDEAVYVADMAEEHSALDGSPCLTGYAARDQGTCGSCYAFAATTAHALQACLSVYNAGGNAEDFPMLSAQGMVSCGLEHGYTGGCEGGSGYYSMKYLEDIGSTIVGCWPYSSGGGNALEHFDSHGNEVRAFSAHCPSQSRPSLLNPENGCG